MEKALRKEREFNLRRAEILNHAESIFSAKGFHRSTVSEIAEASGFAVGTIYQIFENKEQLFAAMVTEKLDMFYGEIRAAAAREKSVKAKIGAVVKAHFDFVENNMNFCAIFLRRESTSLAEVSNVLRDWVINAYLDHIAFIEAIMSQGVESRILNGGKSPRLMAFALAGMINSFTFSWVQAPGNFSLAEMNDVLIDIFLEGVKAVDF